MKPATLFSTYSIVARDPATGQIGAAVQTHQMAVGSMVPWLEPGVGAVATQSLVNVRLGPLGLAMMREGVPPDRVIAALVASDPEASRRQVGLIDAQGRAAAWTGDGCIREAAHQTGENFSVQANMMTRATVIPAMVGAFQSAPGDLAARMLSALQAAQAEAGDIRGMQSAALKVVPASHDLHAVYDLRVDEHEDPITELGRLVRLRYAQLIDQQGYEALASDQYERALDLWAQAREQAPELEEIPYWQAITLADDRGDVETAVQLLDGMLAADPRRGHWLDLIERLAACGLFKDADRAAALLKALR